MISLDDKFQALYSICLDKPVYRSVTQKIALQAITADNLMGRAYIKRRLEVYAADTVDHRIGLAWILVQDSIDKLCERILHGLDSQVLVKNEIDRLKEEIKLIKKIA